MNDDLYELRNNFDIYIKMTEIYESMIDNVETSGDHLMQEASRYMDRARDAFLKEIGMK